MGIRILNGGFLTTVQDLSLIHILVMDAGHAVMDGTPREVFSRVKELKRYSLDVPQVTELADELKAAGMEIPCGILTIDELVAALEPLLKRKEA